MQGSLKDLSVTSKAVKDTTIWPFNKTKNYDDIKKKGEVGLLDFWNGRVKSSLLDPLPSELTTSWIEKKKKVSKNYPKNMQQTVEILLKESTKSQ